MRQASKSSNAEGMAEIGFCGSWIDTLGGFSAAGEVRETAVESGLCVGEDSPDVLPKGLWRLDLKKPGINEAMKSRGGEVA